MNIQSIILLTVILVVAAVVLYRYIKRPKGNCCGCEGCNRQTPLGREDAKCKVEDCRLRDRK